MAAHRTTQRFTRRSQVLFFVFNLFLLQTIDLQKIDAQSFNAEELQAFRTREDSLKNSSDQIVFADEPEVRFRSDSLFIRGLVRALKLKNSFQFPFDSLQTISRLYAPDSSFRIFTWQLKRDEFTFFQRGAIQMRTSDGSLKLIGLHDVSMFTSNPLDSVRSPANWIGAIYYRIILKTWNGKKFYTLLGYDDYSISSTKKWMEVLTFDDRGEPQFGGHYITFKEDSIKKTDWDRFNIEYKKEATTTFNYDPQLDMIIFDQLIPESNEDSKKDTYIPDGEYEGFKWKDGQWVHVEKLFNFQLKDGEFPQDQKILNDNGTPDEQKLLEQSEKNQKRASETNKSKPAPPVKKDNG
jgi:hypothetical protein